MTLTDTVWEEDTIEGFDRVGLGSKRLRVNIVAKHERPEPARTPDGCGGVMFVEGAIVIMACREHWIPSPGARAPAHELSVALQCARPVEVEVEVDRIIHPEYAFNLNKGSRDAGLAHGVGAPAPNRRVAPQCTRKVATAGDCTHVVEAFDRVWLLAP